jgi:hypothetical protein
MTTDTRPPRTEEFRVTGEDIINKIKELVAEGNVRRILVRSEDGRMLAEFPLTVGVIGIALLPVWAAIGAIVALATHCTIVIERLDEQG